MGQQESILGFNGGEFSPLLNRKVDLVSFRNGCKQLNNLFPTPYGNSECRRGTLFRAKTKFADRPARGMGFEFSRTTNFILELGDLYMRFFTNNQQVMSGPSPYEIATPWSSEGWRPA